MNPIPSWQNRTPDHNATNSGDHVAGTDTDAPFLELAVRGLGASARHYAPETRSIYRNTQCVAIDGRRPGCAIVHLLGPSYHGIVDGCGVSIESGVSEINPYGPILRRNVKSTR